MQSLQSEDEDSPFLAKHSDFYQLSLTGQPSKHLSNTSHLKSKTKGSIHQKEDTEAEVAALAFTLLCGTEKELMFKPGGW